MTKQPRKTNRFTDEQIAAADAIDIAALLEEKGEQLQRCGHEVHWRRQGEISVSIDGNRWYCYYSGKGGGAIAFVQKFFGLPFKGAMNYLLGQSVNCNLSSLPNEQKLKELQLPPRDNSNSLVREYLTGQRGIAPEIVQHFIATGQIYQSQEVNEITHKVYRNLVIVGLDGAGNPRQAHVKGMLSRAFRHDAEGSDKAVGFAHLGQSNTLFVFEAAVDLMSYLTLYPQNWQQHSYLALNGTASCALLQTLQENPHLQHMVLALDNDEGGQKAVENLTRILHRMGYVDIRVNLPDCKDWNEQLCKEHTQEVCAGLMGMSL